ncbi:hypothetical protein KAJ27_14160 [bacterium]|nr:hypothetical protein [bacterium]
MEKNPSENRLKEMLQSGSVEEILKALDILYNKYCAPLIPVITEHTEHEDQLIKSAAKKILKKYELISKKVMNEKEFSFESIEDFIKEFSTVNNPALKAKIIKSLNHYRIKPSDVNLQDDLLELYLDETDRSISSSFAKILFKWFDKKITTTLLNAIQKKNKNHLINAIIGLMKFDTPRGVEKVVDLYEFLGDVEFVYFASIYLWEYSKLIVIAKLKSLVQGSEKDKILAAKICTVLSHHRLQGIIQLMIEDPSQKVRIKAAAALQRLEKKTGQQKTIHKKTQHLSENFYTRFTKILTEGNDFHEKLMIMNILDNLGHKEFLPIVEQELKWETNLFLISSYVKFLGKHGNNNYLDMLIPYLEYEDSRVVANCLEGLSYSRPEKRLINIFLKYITNKHHRISSHAALALWKAKEKEIVCEYLEKSIKSDQLWKRKAALHTIDHIMSPELKKFVIALRNDSNGEISAQSGLLLNMLKDKETEDNVAPEQIIDHILETGKIPEHIIQAKYEIIKSNTTPLDEKISAVQKLSFIASDANYKDLYQFYLNAVDTKLVAALVRTIGMTFSGGKQFLLDILRDSFEPRILANALETLFFHDYKDCLTEIFPFLYHENPKIISITTGLLYKIMPEEIFEKLVKMTESSNVKVRKSALFGLNRIRTPKSYILIQKFLLDEDMDIAIASSDILAKFETDKEFLACLQEEKSNTVELIGKRHSPEESNKEEIVKPIEKPIEKIEIKEEEKKVDSFDEILAGIQSTPLNLLDQYFEMKLNPKITEKNIIKVLKIAKNTDQTEISIPLNLSLAKFLNREEVQNYFETSLCSNDVSIKLAGISGLQNAISNKLLLFDTLLNLLTDENGEISDCAFKTLLSNNGYRTKFFSLINSADPVVEIYTDYIFKKCPEISNSIKSELKKEDPEKATVPKEKTKKKIIGSSVQKNRKSVSSQTEKTKPKQNAWGKNSTETKKTSEPDKPDFDIKKIAIPVISILVIIIVGYGGFYIYDEFIKSPVADQRDIRNSGATSSSQNDDNKNHPEIKSDLKNILINWKKIADNPEFDKTQIIENLISAVNSVSKNYKRKEFYKVKKLLEEKKVSTAKKQMIKTLKLISKGYVLWNHKKNEWISQKEANKRWSQVIDD